MKFKIGDTVKHKKTGETDIVDLVPGMRKYDERNYGHPKEGFVLRNDSWSWQKKWVKVTRLNRLIKVGDKVKEISSSGDIGVVVTEKAFEKEWRSPQGGNNLSKGYIPVDWGKGIGIKQIQIKQVCLINKQGQSPKPKPKFKVGDKVKIKTACSGTKIGEIYTLVDSNYGLRAGDCNCLTKWEHSNSMPKLKVGDKITGITGEKSYGITTEDAVMEVMAHKVDDDKGDDIVVKVLEHEKDKKYIGKIYSVQSKYFRKINKPFSMKFEPTADNMCPIYWECTDNGSKKFWAAHIIKKGAKFALVRKWGRIGNNPQGMEQVFDDKYKAEEALKQLVRAKESKGYEPIF